jgi:hypothetical protein
MAPRAGMIPRAERAISHYHIKELSPFELRHIDEFDVQGVNDYVPEKNALSHAARNNPSHFVRVYVRSGIR